MLIIYFKYRVARALSSANIITQYSRFFVTHLQIFFVFLTDAKTVLTRFVKKLFYCRNDSLPKNNGRWKKKQKTTWHWSEFTRAKQDSSRKSPVGQVPGSQRLQQLGSLSCSNRLVNHSWQYSTMQRGNSRGNSPRDCVLHRLVLPRF